MEEPNLFKQLTAEWQSAADGPQARAACAQWARSNSVLTAFASPAAVVAHCHERGHPADSAAVLRAVLGEVGSGPWPARTVLQAVLPGIASVARRARRLIGPTTPWQRRDELAQELVTTAYDRIEALAADPPPWPAMAIVDGSWQHLRQAAIAERRRSDTKDRLESAAHTAPAEPPTPAEELAHALVDAVELGILEQVDARLIYASRVEDRAMEELAPGVGHNAWWGWRRRLCAERALVGAGPAIMTLAV